MSSIEIPKIDFTLRRECEVHLLNPDDTRQISAFIHGYLTGKQNSGIRYMGQNLNTSIEVIGMYRFMFMYCDDAKQEMEQLFGNVGNFAEMLNGVIERTEK